MEGVARGLGRKVIRHPDIEGRIREYFGDKINEARLRLSEVPEGAELIVDGRLGFPTIKCENIYILPGIPEILVQKFQALRERFAASPYFLRVVYTCDGEGAIAEHLNATMAAFPELLLGSYPKIGDPEYAVKLTLESKDQAYVERALAHLLGLLPSEAVVRTE
jgi:molybdopterin-biosynthesis enzyme MoeA-like protein